MSSSAWLSIVGGLLEILGFLVVAVELFRTQRRELGTPKAIAELTRNRRRLALSVRRLLVRRRPPEPAEPKSSPAYLGPLRAEGTSSASATLTAGPPSLEKRVWTLESELTKLSTEVRASRTKAEKNLEQVQRRYTDKLAELQEEQRKREAAEKEFLRASVTLQWCGIGLFVSGTVASAIANLIG